MAWKEIIYLHKHTAKEIAEFGNKSSSEIYFDISGDKGFSIEQLSALNTILEKQPYAVNLQYGIKYLERKEGLVYNLDILKYIPSVKDLSVINHEYEESIENFDFLYNTPSLISFRTLGLFKKSISFEPFKQLTDVKKLSFDFGLNKKQQEVVNDIIVLLDTLSVPELDVTNIPVCPHMKSLRIEKKLVSPELLPKVFPRLQSLYLKKVKNCEDFSFISEMKSLRALTLHWIFQIETLPVMSEVTNLEILEIVGSPNLQYGLDNIFCLKKLRGLMLTEIQYPPASDFIRLTDLKKLESVYIYYRKNKREDELIQEFIEEHNWIYKQPGLAGVVI